MAQEPFLAEGVPLQGLLSNPAHAARQIIGHRQCVAIPTMRRPASLRPARGLPPWTKTGSAAQLRADASFPIGARALRVQIISPALAEIMGGRRLWTVSMISAVSIPSR